MSTDKVTLPTAASLIGCSRQWAHELWKKGKFPNAEVVGTTVIVPVSDVQSYIEQKESA